MAQPALALSTSRPARTIMLCAMYLAQGIPWGFMTIALVSYLLGQGVSDAEAGVLTGMVLLPWTFKIIWAPLIDTMTIRSMGRRRPWIIFAELMMAVSLLGIILLGDISQDLQLLGWMFFLHNCFAALQDVATDALALDLLSPQEQGRINGLMWGSKLVGKGIGGFAMMRIINHWGLTEAVMFQFFVLLVIMLFPLYFVERPGERRLPWSRGAADLGDSAAGVRSPTAVVADLIRAYSLATTGVFLVFGAINLIGWGIIEVVTKALYIKELGWKDVEVTDVSSFAILTEMAGALLGGYLADRVGRRCAMVLGFGMYGLAALCVAACPFLWDERWFTTSYLLINPGVLAMGSVGFLSMSMRISWTTAAATVFTIYMTVSNIGHVAGNYLVGPIRGEYGLGLSYGETFCFAGLLMIAPLALLLVVRPEQVDRLKAHEPPYDEPLRDLAIPVDAIGD